MRKSWIDILFEGSLDIEVPHLSIVCGEKQEYKGTGSISWREHAGIQLRAQTESANLLSHALDAWNQVPGKLISDEHYVEMRGVTQNGKSVSTKRWSFDGCTTHTESGVALWDQNVASIWEKSEGTDQSSEVLYALIGPSLIEYTRSTTTVVENPVFKSHSGVRDWLLVETENWKIGIRERSGKWCEVRVVVANKTSISDPLKFLRAITDSVAFLIGKQCVIRGYEHQRGGQTYRYLAQQLPVDEENAIPQPIGLNSAYHEGAERLLSKAIPFFLTEVGGKVAMHLRLGWDTLENHWPTRIVVASTALEGLIGLVGGDAPIVASEIPEDDVAAIAKLLETNPVGLSERMLNRIRGFAQNSSKPRAIDILNDSAARGVMGITKEDAEAWKTLRNSAAHAGLVTPAESDEKLQKQINHLFRVINIMNRIVLQVIGYQGKYVDYSGDWRLAVDFPAASPDTLKTPS